jgi:hypothetical protein
MKSLIIVAFIVSICVITRSQTEPKKPSNECDPGNMAGAAPELFKKVNRFVVDLQSAIAHNDKSAVALLIKYPISVETKKGALLVHSKRELIEQYEKIFTPELKQIIANQRPSCVNLMGAKGFMLAHGEVWFNEFYGRDLKIFAINPVVPASASHP